MAVAVTHELSFAFGVNADTQPAGGDWVDLAGRILEVHPKSGRDSQSASFGAASMRVVLDNADGELDPDNTGGTYYGDLVPMVQVRYRVTRGATNYDTFFGYVDMDGWVARTIHPEMSVVEVNVVDMFEVLANTRLPASVWEREMRLSAPAYWWRLGEGRGTTMLDWSGNNRHGTYMNGASFNNRSGLVEFDDDNAIEFHTKDDNVAYTDRLRRGRYSGVSVGGSFSVAFWMTTTLGVISIGPLSPALMQGHALSSDKFGGGSGIDGLRGWLVGYSSNVSDFGNMHLIVGDGTNQRDVRTDVTGGFMISDTRQIEGRVFFMVATYNVSTGAVAWYVDGVAVATVNGAANTTSSGVTPAAGTMWVGGESLDTPVADGGGVTFPGILDEVSVWNRVLSAGEVSTLYAAGTTPWLGDGSGARVGRILDIAGVPSALRNIDTGSSTLQATRLGGDALSYLQRVAQTEYAALFVDHRDSGKLRFRGRSTTFSSAPHNTSQATFGDGVGEVPYDELVLDQTEIVNEATVSRENGYPIVVSDSTSQDKYLPRAVDRSGLMHDSDDEAQGLAEWLVNRQSSPVRRPRSVRLVPADHTARWEQVLGRKIGDRVTVKHRPPYGGALSWDALIEGIDHRFRASDGKWVTTFALGAIDAPTAFTWDSDADHGWDAGVWVY